MAIEKEVIYNKAGEIIETINHIVPDPSPKVLTKTAFMDHAIAQLGSISAFQTLMESCRDSTDATYGTTLRYAYARYDAADLLNKDMVAVLSDTMVNAGLLSSQARTAVLDNWPTL